MNLRDAAWRLATESKPLCIKVVGNSMAPKIRSGELIWLEPVGREGKIEKGDIVLAHVSGRFYVHLVSGVRDGKVQISNNHGRINGWTSRARVYGRVIRE